MCSLLSADAACVMELEAASEFLPCGKHTTVGYSILFLHAFGNELGTDDAGGLLMTWIGTLKHSVLAHGQLCQLHQSELVTPQHMLLRPGDHDVVLCEVRQFENLVDAPNDVLYTAYLRELGLT